jgi:hypothetical protein
VAGHHEAVVLSSVRVGTCLARTDSIHDSLLPKGVGDRCLEESKQPLPNAGVFPPMLSYRGRNAPPGPERWNIFGFLLTHSTRRRPYYSFFIFWNGEEKKGGNCVFLVMKRCIFLPIPKRTFPTKKPSSFQNRYRTPEEMKGRGKKSATPQKGNREMAGVDIGMRDHRMVYIGKV